MPEFHYIDDHVFTVSEFLTPKQSRDYILLAESLGFGEAPITTPMGPVMRKDVRNNDRVMLDDLPRAEQLWNLAKAYVPANFKGRPAVGVNERLRFYRYGPGQQFDWHHDGSFRRENGERSYWTFMVYLNHDFTGGETSFQDVAAAPQIQIQPEPGLALFFHHPLLHKGEPVVEGRKYVLRTDVMYGPRE